MSKFPDMLVYFRRRDGFSQQDLADRLNCSKSLISMYEQGQRKPSFEQLEAIADLFNVNMSTLVGEEKPAPEIESELDSDIIRLFGLLSSDEKLKLLGYLQGLLSSREE